MKYVSELSNPVYLYSSQYITLIKAAGEARCGWYVEHARLLPRMDKEEPEKYLHSEGRFRDQYGLEFLIRWRDMCNVAGIMTFHLLEQAQGAKSTRLQSLVPSQSSRRPFVSLRKLIFVD